MADPEKKTFYRADHLANERTFLAWIRTNLGLMAFGFVVEKFSFFTQQIAAFLDRAGLPVKKGVPTAIEGYSFTFGISLVALGAVLCLFSFLKFKKIERDIATDNYHSSVALDTFLTIFVFLTGVFLIIYLINSHKTL